MDKQTIIDALAKRLPDISDEEIEAILEIPDDWWPSNPYKHTSKDLVEEKVRRRVASEIPNAEILRDATDVALLRHLISFGPMVFPELDELGNDLIRKELKSRETAFKAKLAKWELQ